MSTEAILRLVVESLDAAGVPYMVTGSLASAYYGDPRATRDVDVVVRANASQLQRVGERLRAAGLYCEPLAIIEAAQLEGMFNAIDPTSGWKVDFIVLKDQPFSRAAFEARARIELGGVQLHMIRAEDIVVAKMEWAKSSGSARQLQDVVGVLVVQGATLDRSHVERWVAALGLTDEWRKVLELERAQGGPSVA